jgi:hypothetical protein
MANSDKNILITPNTGTTSRPSIKFTGADNAPIYAYVNDDGTVSFEGSAGQLFAVSDGMTGTIFSVNDISGLPNIEVYDTGLTRILGGFGRSYVEVNSSTYVVPPTANWINVIFNSTCTLTLPSPAAFPGREITVKTANNSITVSSSISNVVQRAAAVTSTTTTIVSGAGQWARLVSNGTNWIIMMANY